MKVKLLVSLAGSRIAYAPGAEIEVTAKEALRYVEKGIAEIIQQKPKPKAKPKTKIKK